jgi:2-phosphosulfolactate phosphatase
MEPSRRPIILLSTSGTRLIAEASARGDTYVSCLRNAAAQSRRLVALDRDVAIFGADSRGEFREEDQLCAVRIAAPLVADGHRPADDFTEGLIERWAGAPDDSFLSSRSARYLRDTDQEHDLRYVLEHIEDLTSVFVMRDGQVVAEE